MAGLSDNDDCARDSTAVSTIVSVETADEECVVILAEVSYYPDAVAPGCFDVAPGVGLGHCHLHYVRQSYLAPMIGQPDAADVALLA